jgi:hypothetical protein
VARKGVEKEVVLNRALADQRVKKRDELGLREGGRLMAIRRQAVLEMVAAVTVKGVRSVKYWAA